MDIDVEKLIFLIENRPAIYNHKLKEHNSRNIVESLWTEIEEEMKCTVQECKSKWMSLRNSYAREIRQQKITKSTKKRWYLADAMSFMKDYLQVHRTNSTTPTTTTNIEEDENTVNSSISFVDINNLATATTPQLSELTQKQQQQQHSPENDTQQPPPAKKPKQMSLADKVAGPMIEFLKSRSKPEFLQLRSTKSSQDDDNNNNDEILYFFKGLLSDIKQLTPLRQRTLKRQIFNQVMNLVDEQEYENSLLLVNSNTNTSAKIE